MFPIGKVSPRTVPGISDHELYQNSQTMTHAAGGLLGHPLQIRMEVQRDIGAALDADDGADESTSPQAGIRSPAGSRRSKGAPAVRRI